MQPPFFVIGAPRSGTSYLVQVLDRHPEILLTNETRVMTFMHRSLTRHSRDKMALMTERRKFLATYRRHIPNIVRDFYRDLGAGESTRWGDKFPHYADAKTDPNLLQFIAETFPKCQFIHITRDGRDVVASLMDKGWADLDEACDVWVRHVAASRKLGESVGASRFHELRYEDLIEDGVGTSRGILSFLGLGQSQLVDSFIEEQANDRTPFSGATTDPAEIGQTNWSRRLTDGQISQIEAFLAPTLRELNYPAAASYVGPSASEGA